MFHNYSTCWENAEAILSDHEWKAGWRLFSWWPFRNQSLFVKLLDIATAGFWLFNWSKVKGVDQTSKPYHQSYWPMAMTCQNNQSNTSIFRQGCKKTWRCPNTQGAPRGVEKGGVPKNQLCLKLQKKTTVDCSNFDLGGLKHFETYPSHSSVQSWQIYTTLGCLFSKPKHCAVLPKRCLSKTVLQ